MKKILFLTGTRADYGKLKALMLRVEENPLFECYLFVTGMHTLNEFGNTKTEIYKDKFTNVHVYMNQIIEEPMDLVLANTINGFSRYIRELLPDLIVVHGDRVEALAATISGVMSNILVAHVEGGEVSGAIDESIRHAISKFAHVHFVNNTVSKTRLLQLGESSKSIFVIGSPDIDFIVKLNPIPIKEIKQRYNINFEDYGILIFHPVTTEIKQLGSNISTLVTAVVRSEMNYIVINPNNDEGYKIILNEYKRFENNNKIKCFPSIRFEFFIELLRNAKFIIGNSSVGIHEAPVVGIPTINLGSRQNNRFNYDTIINAQFEVEQILIDVKRSQEMKVVVSEHYGTGNSASEFNKILIFEDFWKIPKQKIFNDILNND